MPDERPSGNFMWTLLISITEERRDINVLNAKHATATATATANANTKLIFAVRTNAYISLLEGDWLNGFFLLLAG